MFYALGQKTICLHPVVIVHLAEVSAAGIRKDDYDIFVFFYFSGNLHGRPYGAAARSSCKDSLLSCQSPCHQKRFFIMYLNDVVNEIKIDGLYQVIFSNSLYLVNVWFYELPGFEIIIKN